MNASDYDYLCRVLRERSGIVLSGDKDYLVQSRLSPVARRAGLSDLGALVLKMRSGDEALIVASVEALTTNESFFFRDKTPFEQFTAIMMPAMLAARASRRSIRIWCAAASTGQEPYSLAICLKEMGRALDGWRIEIVATDLSTEVLEKAKAGVYSQFEVQRGLPIQMMLKYFTQSNETWRIAPEIRAMVQFRQLNLLDDFSRLGSFDLVFCRNVLIYFDTATKAAILDRIATSLSDDGVLVLGATETVLGLTQSFMFTPEQRGLFRPARGAVSPPRLAAVV